MTPSRQSDAGRAWAFRLIEAIDELNMWEPGRKGYAAAARRLRDERDWALRELSAEPDPLPPPTREELFTNG